MTVSGACTITNGTVVSSRTNISGTATAPTANTACTVATPGGSTGGTSGGGVGSNGGGSEGGSTSTPPIVTESVNNPSPKPGDTVTITITITNPNSTTTVVLVGSYIPPGLTPSPFTPPFVSVPPGQTVTITVQAVVEPTVCGQTITNSFGLTLTVEDCLPGRMICPLTQSSVPLNTALSVPGFQPTITYTIRVVNNSLQTATSVAVTEPIPQDLIYVSSKASQGTYSPQTGLWSVGTLNGQASAALTIIATANRQVIGKTITNTACVTSAAVDLIPANNIDTSTFTLRNFGSPIIPGFPQTGRADISMLESDAPVNPNRLVISELNINAPIENVGLTKEGNMASPKGAANVGWFELGFKPGEIGNSVIAGHLDSKTGKAVFWDLNKLKAGSVVSIIANDGRTLSFKVIGRKRYSIKNAPLEEIFGSSDEAYLNLITCFGDWLPKEQTYSQRLVVFTKLLIEE